MMTDDDVKHAEIANALETVRIAELMKSNAAVAGNMTKFGRWLDQQRKAADVLRSYGVDITLR